MMPVDVKPMIAGALCMLIIFAHEALCTWLLQMLPFTPISEQLLTRDWVATEYPIVAKALPTAAQGWKVHSLLSVLHRMVWWSSSARLQLSQTWPARMTSRDAHDNKRAVLSIQLRSRIVDAGFHLHGARCHCKGRGVG